MMRNFLSIGLMVALLSSCGHGWTYVERMGPPKAPLKKTYNTVAIGPFANDDGTFRHVMESVFIKQKGWKVLSHQKDSKEILSKLAGRGQSKPDLLVTGTYYENSYDKYPSNKTSVYTVVARPRIKLVEFLTGEVLFNDVIEAQSSDTYFFSDFMGRTHHVSNTKEDIALKFHGLFFPTKHRYNFYHFGDPREPKLKKAFTLVEQEQFEVAIKVFEHLLKTNDNEGILAKGYYGLGVAQMHSSQFAKAKSAFQKSQEIQPDVHVAIQLNYMDMIKKRDRQLKKVKL